MFYCCYADFRLKICCEPLMIRSTAVFTTILPTPGVSCIDEAYSTDMGSQKQNLRNVNGTMLLGPRSQSWVC